MQSALIQALWQDFMHKLLHMYFEVVTNLADVMCSMQDLLQGKNWRCLNGLL